MTTTIKFEMQSLHQMSRLLSWPWYPTSFIDHQHSHTRSQSQDDDLSCIKYDQSSRYELWL